MRRRVDGVECELEKTGAPIRELGDRKLISNANGTRSAVSIRQGDNVLVSYGGKQYLVEPIKAGRKSAHKEHDGDLVSPMPGVVVDVLVTEGEVVEKGRKLLVIEAMKTQQTFVAPFDGKIAQMSVSKGEQIGEGFLMAVVEPAEGSEERE